MSKINRKTNLSAHYENVLRELQKALKQLEERKFEKIDRSESHLNNLLIIHTNINNEISRMEGIMNTISPYLPKEKQILVDDFTKSAKQSGIEELINIIEAKSTSERNGYLNNFMRRLIALKKDFTQIVQEEMKRILSLQRD